VKLNWISDFLFIYFCARIIARNHGGSIAFQCFLENKLW
jgi:hypothetical protein